MPVRTATADESALLRDWKNCKVPVYFDFGDIEEDDTPVLWRRDPISQNNTVYLSLISREQFLRVHHEGLDSEEQISNGVGLIAENRRLASLRQSLPLPKFRRYLAREHRLRRRF